MLFSNKDLKKLIIPLVIEQLLLLLVGMVDVIMIAGVGEDAVSGVSLVDNINILIINVFVALATGGAVVSGHYLGQKDTKKASKAGWQLVLFTSLLSLFVTFIFVFFHEPLLSLIFGRVEQGVMDSAKTYLVVTALSIVPLAVYDSCAAIFRSFGDSKTTMWISVLMNVLHIILNAIFIFGMDMGVLGAAVSTSLSRLFAAVVIFVLLLDDKKKIHFKGYITFRLDMTLIRKILFIGVPNGIENSLFQLGKILLISLVSTFGTSSIAANAVGGTLAGINVLPGLAINYALVSVVSVCIGAGDYKQARYYTKKLLLIAEAALIAVSAVMILGMPFIIQIYRLSEETAKITSTVMIYHAVMAVFFWLPAFSLSNTLRAAGDVVRTMTVSIVSMWVFRIILAYLITSLFDIGLLGVWIAMTIDWIVRSIAFVSRFLGTKWEHCMEKREKVPQL